MGYRRLNPDLITRTLQGIVQRIRNRFPTAGLADVGEALEVVSRAAAQRAEAIRRPNAWLRVGITLIFLSIVAVLWQIISITRVNPQNLTEVSSLVAFVEAFVGTTVFLGAAIAFLFSLETRWKRKRALAALHELRVLAHVIDMHQVAKQPEGLLRHAADGNPQTTTTLYELNRYLNYCTELLVIISKIAALYIQDFHDSAAVTAVDEVETLCGELSTRIWQKLQVVDRFALENHEDPEESTGASDHPSGGLRSQASATANQPVAGSVVESGSKIADS